MLAKLNRSVWLRQSIALNSACQVMQTPVLSLRKNSFTFNKIGLYKLNHCAIASSELKFTKIFHSSVFLLQI